MRHFKIGFHFHTHKISIHAPTWGATIDLKHFLCCQLFQSTHPRGVRHFKIGFRFHTHKISIHAPTWGATGGFCPPLLSFIHFNPRTHVGCDPNKFCFIFLSLLFQSTHPRGVRRNRLNFTYGYNKFQSTHPRGVRLTVLFDQFRMPLFQSTHPRGVRRDNYPTGTTVNQFQSTHPRGVRPLAIRQEANAVNFNPRTHVGCDW